jgi:glucokinase
MILSGDIGGTNTRLAFFEDVDGALVWKLQAKYPSAKYDNLTEIVAEFVEAYHLDIDYACFGIAGPVVNGRAQTTNLPWIIDSVDLAEVLKIDKAHLINDLEANTWGIEVLQPEDFSILNFGNSGASGNCAVISAGTGLGQAGMYFDGVKHHPFACEGGHADFAPRDEMQIDLLNYLLKRFEHVSWERLLSGPGIVNIYEFMRDTDRAPEPSWLLDAMKDDEPARVITEYGMSGTSLLCEKTLNLFCALYGSEAGNLALKTMALGGIYLGGGIAPKIHSRLKDGIFMREFIDKGRMRPLLESVPVRIILNENTALLGAAHYASEKSELKPQVREIIPTSPRQVV